jgi:peroxiredoxin
MKLKTILNSLILISAIAITTSSCKQKPYSTIEGKVETLDTKTTLSLYIREFSTSNKVESKEITPKKNSFKFKLKNILEPTLASIKIDGQNSNEIILLLEPGEKAQISINANNLSHYSIEGSTGSMLIKEINSRLLTTKKTLDSLDNLLQVSSSNEVKQKLAQEQRAAVDSQRVFSSRFIWANPMSRASIIALYQQIAPNRYVLDQSSDLHLFKVVASSQIALYPNSSYAKGMEADIKEMIQRIKNYQIQSMVKDVEQSLPEIALPNTNGDIVKLSSLKGKVIILNFWASWNQSSLFENKELSNLIAELKGKPIVIYNVSLDFDKKSWVAAIETTKMPGVHVCELNAKDPMVVQLYNVAQLPANYIIDKNFDIIGKNVYGDALKQMVKDLL